MQKIAKLFFDNATKTPINIVDITTRYINDVSIEDLLTVNQLFFDYDQQEIQAVFKKITTRNMKIKRMAKDIFKGLAETQYQTEKRYQAPCTV